MSKLYKKLLGAYASGGDTSLTPSDIALVERTQFPEIRENLADAWMLDRRDVEGVGVDTMFDYGLNIYHAALTSTSVDVKKGNAIGKTFNGTTETLVPSSAFTKLITEDYTVTAAFCANADGNLTNNLSIVAGLVTFAGAVSTTNVADGALHTITLINDGATQLCTLYVDGVAESTDVASAGFSLVSAMNLLDGSLFDLRTFNDAKLSTFASKYHAFTESGGLSVSGASAGGGIVFPASPRQSVQTFYGNARFGLQPAREYEYYGPVGINQGATPGNDTNVSIPCPVEGKIYDFKVTCASAPNGDLFCHLVNVTRGTFLEALIEGAGTTTVSLGEFHVAPGDEILVRFTGKLWEYLDSEPANDVGYTDWSWKFLPTDETQQWLINGSGGFVGATSEYTWITAGRSTASNWAGGGGMPNRIVKAPLDGTISDLYAIMETAPAGSEVVEYSIENVTQVTKLTAIFNNAGGNITNNTVDSLAVTAGDELLVTFTRTVGAAAGNDTRHAFCFTPTVAGKRMTSLFLIQFLDNISTTYNDVFSGAVAAGWDTGYTEARWVLDHPLRVDSFEIEQTAAAGVGNGYRYEIRKNNVATGLELTIQDTDTSGSSIGGPANFVKGDEIVLAAVIIGTPPMSTITANKFRMVTSEPTVAPLQEVVQGVIASRTLSTAFSVTADILQDRPDCQLLVATDANMSNVVFTSTHTATQDLVFHEPLTLVDKTCHLVKFTATGLTPETQYWYAIRTQGITDLSCVGKCRTAPVPLVEPVTTRVDKIGMWSCRRNAGDYEGNFSLGGPYSECWREMASKDYDLAICCGDFRYADPAAPLTVLDSNPKYYLGEFRDSMLQTQYQVFSKTTGQCWFPDDHEYKNDPSLGTTGWTAIVSNSNIAQELIMTSYDNPQPLATSFTQGRAGVFDWGNIRYLALDTSFQRGTNVNTSMLGDGGAVNVSGSGLINTWDQEAWIRSALLQAKTDGVKRVRIITASGWLSAFSNSSWAGAFHVDKQRLLSTFIRDSDIPETEMWTGDQHVSFMDDGQSGSLLLHPSDVDGGRFITVQASALWSSDGGSLTVLWDDIFTNTGVVLRVVDGGSAFTWYQSAVTTNSWYLARAAGSTVDPNFSKPTKFRQDGDFKNFRVDAASLVSDNWGFGDVDGLGFNTIYFRPVVNAQPDILTTTLHYGESWLTCLDTETNGVDRTNALYNLDQVYGRTVYNLTTEFASDYRNNDIELSSATYAVDDDAGVVTIRVNKIDWFGPTTIETFTTAGTAVDGVNYTGHTATERTFLPNKGFLEFDIPVINAGGGTFTVTIQNPGSNGQLGAITSATVTITDV